jgi:hypothetical protein
MLATLLDLGARIVPVQTEPSFPTFQYGAAKSVVSPLGLWLNRRART